MDNKMIFRRREVKYRLTRSQAEDLCRVMEPHMRPDPHGRSVIQSLYLDTPDFRLIRRSMEHPLYKEKLRLRSYGVAKWDTRVFLELKKKFKKVVYKRRVELALTEAEEYLRTGETCRDCQIMREIDYCRRIYPELEPRMLLSYRRAAFFGRENEDFRMTFDEAIKWRTKELSLSAGIYGRDLLPEDTVLLEVKTAGGMPLWLVHYLSVNHIYKTSFSKYATAYQIWFEETWRRPSPSVSPLPLPVVRKEYRYA